jgi:ComF family protein
MLEGLARSVIDSLAPACCVDCGLGLGGHAPAICADCARRLPWWRALDGCPRCGTDGLDRSNGADRSTPSARTICGGCYSMGSPLHACHALLHYEGRARNWIPRFKRHRMSMGPALTSRLAIEFLTDEFAVRLAKQRVQRPDLIVPIPLHPRRKRRRGFNHADLIARRLAKRLDLRCDTRQLVRRRNTSAQAQLDGPARRDNMRRAFRTRQPMELIERVWLVDDVLTTGATLEAAAEALLEAGVEEVYGLTLAATRPRPRPNTPVQRARTSAGAGAETHVSSAASSDLPGRPATAGPL